MAIPSLVHSEFNSPNFSQQYGNPVQSAGDDYYAVARGSGSLSSTLFMYKTSSLANTWAEQDSSNRPVIDQANFSVLGAALFQEVAEDMIHTIGCNNTVNFDNHGEVWYSRFDMGSDTWEDLDGAGAMESFIYSVEDQDSDHFNYCDLVVLSDHKIRVVYQGDTDKVMGQDRNRIESVFSIDSGETWSTPQTVSNSATAAFSYTGPHVVAPANNSDQVHYCFNDSATLWTRGQTSTNSMRTPRDTGETTQAHGNSQTKPITFARGGTEIIRQAYRANTGDGHLRIFEMDAFSDDSAGSFGSSATSISDPCTAHALYRTLRYWRPRENTF